MSKKDQHPPQPRQDVLAAVAGLWLAVTLFKFGNPVILDHQITAPTTLSDAMMSSWPVLWALCFTEVLLLFGLCRGRSPIWWLAALVPLHWLIVPPDFLLWDLGLVGIALVAWYAWRSASRFPGWLALAPLIWLAWQIMSAIINWGRLGDSAQRHLVLTTLIHFLVCVLTFYFGAEMTLARVGAAAPDQRLARERLLWLCLGGGFLIVLAAGWRQHFGGLEETRQYFFALPNWRSFPPEFIQKLSSDRIYGTLFYPNAFAGVILLLLPPVAMRWWFGEMPSSLRIGGLAGILTLALGALYWSGSKAGWLICLGQGLAAALALGTRGKVRWIMLSVLLVVGLAGFGLRYRAYLAGGATSFAARLDYWQAAWSGAMARPVFGSGPGTFAGTYREFKRPEAEMTKLAHNDFLQQGADSGWMGLVTYAAWLLGGMGLLLVRVYRGKEVCSLGVALGLAGITVQGFLEFWLYIPALAWPAFFLLGLALAPEPGGPAGRNPIDKKNSPAPKSKPSVANAHH